MRGGHTPENEGRQARTRTDKAAILAFSCVLFGAMINCIPEQRKRNRREIGLKIRGAQNLHICAKSSNFAAELKTAYTMENKQEIKFDERNYRKHSKKNKALIKKSLEELGAGRSVVIDADDTLVAGNGVYEQAQALQMPVRVIETDGSELVVVKRTDIHTQDEKRKKLALADNAASDLSEWDVPLIETDWAKEMLVDWGVELPEVVNDERLKELLDEANFESLNDVARERTGMRQICFVMQAEQAYVVNAYIKQHGKNELITKIVELCQQQEVK